jgi:diguanylate cyclase (GGDEF)-like protein
MPSRSSRTLGAIALLTASALVLGIAVFALTDSGQSEVEIAEVHLDRLQVLARVVADDVDEQEASLDDFLLTGDHRALSRYYEAVASEAAADKAIASEDFGLPEIEQRLADLSSMSDEWRREVAEPAIQARRAGNQADLDAYVNLVVGDHDDIETVSNRIEQLLQDTQIDLTARAAYVGDTRLAGTAGSFAVFVVAFLLALFVVRRFGKTLELDARQASVLNRFTEVTSFAGEDRQIAIANLAALGRLVRPDASVTHVLNRSLDRAVPEASTGDAIAEVLPMHDMGRCAGILRGTMYVSDDLADDLSVHCPVYPAPSGTLACIPLISGESVGAVHLYWAAPRAMPLALRAAVARITEHAALSIGNRRLLAALHGQANTDPRTGLANSRAFDRAVEEALSARSEHEAASILMLDLDHFKQFNDRHGHPAGDEALRSFGSVLRSCMRDGDVAARYGGEEFAVLLLGVDGQAAVAVAERIRARTESTIISLAPGMTDRITVSVGIASAPEQGLERVTLLRLADEALYRAKEAGRNRVESAGHWARVGELDVPEASVADRLPATSRVRRRAS